MKIYLDPGHSGPVEPGACHGDIHEADVNLQIALAAQLSLEEKGHAVVLTRQGDIDDDGLSWRCDLANQAEADLFISIHCNSSNNPAAQGVEIFHCQGSTYGKLLAEYAFDALVAAQYTIPRRVKSARFTVLYNTNMPAILVECGFLSNDQDRALITDPVTQAAIGQALAAAVDVYQAKVSQR